MRLYGLIGYPLKNSFSENYFNQKFNTLGLDAQYRNFPLADISEFQELLHKQPSLSGLNVTIPYKETIIPFLDELSPEAEQIGAVNTIQFLNGKLIGHNTDVVGFEKSILPVLKPWHQHALILGSGGAAKAVAFVLKKLGLNYHIVSRNPEVGITYDELDKPFIRAHQVIINCTPLGMFPNVDEFPLIPYEFITALHLAHDLIYLPEETLFLKQAKQHGAVTKNGLVMLHQQAEKAWQIWNNSAL